MGLDGGRDFFLHLITWNKPARQSHALIVEVGAGDGRQAVKAAQLGFRVISVDAAASNLEIGKDFLAQALKAGPLDGNLTWKHSAVSDYTGEAHFWTRRGIGRLLDSSDPKSVTHKDNPKWSGETNKVPVNKLDDIIAPSERPYILKVDVEGHELSVFRGAARILEQKPPIVIFEFNPAMIRWSAKHDPYELLKLFHDLGYDLYDTQISEPGTKGFIKKYGSFHRPSDFRGFVRWLNQSTEFDWWGSWTDIVAIQPDVPPL